MQKVTGEFEKTKRKAHCTFIEYCIKQILHYRKDRCF